MNPHNNFRSRRSSDVVYLKFIRAAAKLPPLKHETGKSRSNFAGVGDPRVSSSALPGTSLATDRSRSSSGSGKSMEFVFELAEPIPGTSIHGSKLPGAAPLYRLAGGLLASTCGANAHARRTWFALCPD